MTIGKGTGWGTPGLLPVDAPVVDSDSALRALVERARHDGAILGPVGLTGGSLWTTMGGPTTVGRLRTDEAMRYPIDVVSVVADDNTRRWFVGSLVARTRFWTNALVAMNGQFLDGRRVGVRAHPGDGLVDVYDASLALADVAKVAARARHGTHLPHPGIHERRVAEWESKFDRSRTLWLDGERVGRIRSIRLSVEPDALTVVI